MSYTYIFLTLLGEGVDADRKLDETINKYANEEKMNIVMDNFNFYYT